jgi:hypothetical protein
MKKIIFLLLAAALLSIQLYAQTTAPAPAQNCICNPNGWQPFTAIIVNNTSTINCGHQFALKCNERITLRSEYKCTGPCVAKYKAVVKNSAGVVVANYPVFTFPWSYSFAAAGNYSLEITPLCGNNSCTPCRFYFTVTCVSCDCETNGWQPFTASYNNGESTQTVNCGFQFGVKKQELFKLKGLYKCKGNCTAKYVAVLKNNVTGAVIRNYSPFTFPWTYTFTAAGNYKLEITPICGTKKCPPCVFYFTVN